MRVKPTPSSKPLPARPKFPIPALPIPRPSPTKSTSNNPNPNTAKPTPQTAPVIIFGSDDDVNPSLAAAPNPAPTRKQPPRAASYAPKSYLEVPPSLPSPAQISNRNTSAAPSYASASQGGFQVVVNKKRKSPFKPTPAAESSPRDREIIVTRHQTKPAITPSFIQRITELIRKRLCRTKCQGTMSTIRTSAKGNLVLTSDPHHLSSDIWPFKSLIIDALNDTGIGSFDIDLNKPLLPFFINGILLTYPDSANHPSWTPEDWDDASFTKIKSNFALSKGIIPIDHPLIIGGLARLKAQKSIKAAIVINTI